MDYRNHGVLQGEPPLGGPLGNLCCDVMRTAALWGVLTDVCKTLVTQDVMNVKTVCHTSRQTN